jgi:alcohol dehydrogenase
VGAALISPCRRLFRGHGRRGLVAAADQPPPGRFNAVVCADRIADVAFALGAGETGQTAGRNAGAAIASLADRVGMTHAMADFGISAADFDQIAADALDDEVLASTPRRPDAADIRSILQAARQ